MKVSTSTPTFRNKASSSGERSPTFFDRASSSGGGTPTFRERCSSVGALVEQPLGWSQGTVHCEQENDSAGVSRWAGKLRDLKQAPHKRRHSAKQLLTTDAEVKAANPNPPASPPVQTKAVPPSLLAGLSSPAQAANSHVQHRGVRLARINKTRRDTTNKPAIEDIDVKGFEKTALRLTADVTDIRARHDTFQPMSQAQKARAALFLHSKQHSTESQPADDEDERGGNWSEKMQAWKYVRKIEPELPPLEHIPPEFSKIKKDQTVVHFNARSDIISRNAPEAQLEWLAYKGASREAHHCVVAELRARRKADFLDKRRADAFQTHKVEDLGEDEEEPFMADAGKDGMAAKWLVNLARLSFLYTAREEIKLRNMSSKEREDYVADPDVAARLSVSKTTSGYAKQAMVISSALKDPGTKGRMDMLQCMFMMMMKTRAARKRAKIIHTCLGNWYRCGSIFLTLKAFSSRIRFLQKWWRTVCVPKLAQSRAKLSQRWLRIERAVALQDIKARDLKEAKEAKAKKDALRGSALRRAQLLPAPETVADLIPIEERINLYMISDSVRTTFIANELRTRRYLLLPQIAMWEEDVKAWDKQHAEWQETRKMLKVMNVEGADHGGFHWPPQRPTYMPAEFGSEREKGEREIMDMIKRARAHPNGGGWTEVPKKIVGQTCSIALGALNAKKHGDYSPGCDEDHPFGQVSREDLEGYQLTEDLLPIEFRETAPGLKAPEWRQRP